ncbi:MAG: thiol-disulfide oxidoreductase DCC family protein [Saprospiraceae bacterium]|nr:thiol-disulfide oxidoreductase DCC family protein [Saprospiraceae bacterium]
MADHNSNPVLLFDGVCNLCNGFVQFVIERDPKAKFHFAALQSDPGKKLLSEQDQELGGLDTVILVQKGKVYTKSDVALRVSQGLSGLWPLLQIFFIVPKFIRDPLYDWVAKNRYRWFGKMEQCMIPTPELSSRFLD